MSKFQNLMLSNLKVRCDFKQFVMREWGPLMEADKTAEWRGGSRVCTFCDVQIALHLKDHAFQRSHFIPIIYSAETEHLTMHILFLPHYFSQMRWSSMVWNKIAPPETHELRTLLMLQPSSPGRSHRNARPPLSHWPVTRSQVYFGKEKKRS